MGPHKDKHIKLGIRFDDRLGPHVFDTVSGREVEHIGVELITHVKEATRMKLLTFVYIEQQIALGYFSSIKPTEKTCRKSRS